MAFQMIHMEIAYRLLNRIPWITNRADFILGSVAPDAVHMKADFCMEQKVHSHMFEGCGEWGDTQDYNRWERNVTSFLYKLGTRKEEKEFTALAYGLCVHCFTDYWNDLRIWRKLQSENIPPMTPEQFRAEYYPEAKGIDRWLYQNSEHTEAIRKLMTEAVAHDIHGLVEKKTLEQQREYLLNVQYHAEKIDIGSFRFLSAAKIEEFILFCVEDIAYRLLKTRS